MSRVEGSRAESNMLDALNAKNAEIESLVKSLDSWKKKATASEEKLSSLQVRSYIAPFSCLFISVLAKESAYFPTICSICFGNTFSDLVLLVGIRFRCLDLLMVDFSLCSNFGILQKCMLYILFLLHVNALMVI